MTILSFPCFWTRSRRRRTPYFLSPASGQDRAGAELLPPRTLEVDRDELVEVLLLGIGDFGRRAADSCVVVRAVQPPVALNCRSDEAADLLAIGNVHLVEECVATHLANGFGNRLALVWIAVDRKSTRLNSSH